MRRLALTALMTLNWLLLSPSLQLPERGFVEVGVTPAAAQQYQGIMAKEPGTQTSTSKKSVKKKSKRARVGSSGIVRSNQPGLHPMQTITPPQSPVVTGTVTRAPDVQGFPNVPTVPVVPNGRGGETSQDRVSRCAHQGALGGLPPGQQGTYIHNCAFLFLTVSATRR